MTNRVLYKRGIMGIWKMFLVLAAVLAMYFTIIVTMFDPELGSALNEFSKAMPELMAMVGMNPADTTLVGFMAAYLYGFIMLVFPMIFSIICANKLIAQQVDKGSMVYLISAPITRSSVALTQIKVLISGIFALVAFAAVLGIAVCEAFFPAELEISKFLFLNMGALCLHLFIGSICFLCSCIFSETKYSIGFGVGIPALGIIIQMMANAGAKLESAKYFTFFTLFHPSGIITGEPSAFWQAAVLFAGACLLFGAGIVVFSKKDLHI